jgi:pimeloyl-ACP methyl ester carboxylesterase
MTTTTPLPRSVQTNGIQLAYYEEGAGEPLVLIMGLGADASAWRLHLDAYRERFRCFAVDNRGSGASSKPEGPYSTAQMAEDYAGLVRELGLGAVRVVGVSMGGAIAQELALRHPELVERMVIVSSWARCDAYTAEVFRHFAAARSQVGLSDFTQLLQLWIWSPRYLAANFDELLQVRTAELPPPMEQAAFEAQCVACVTHDTLGRLPQIRVPTLITAGAADIFTPLRFAEVLHASIAGSEIHVFPNAAHAHHWECLDMFNELTSDWLTAQ